MISKGREADFFWLESARSKRIQAPRYSAIAEKLIK
jgi:hypothetical protein